MLIFSYPKHDPGTRTESFKPMWLSFWEHGERKTRQGTVPSYFEVFSNNSQLPPSFSEMGGPTYQTP